MPERIFSFVDPEDQSVLRIVGPFADGSIHLAVEPPGAATSHDVVDVRLPLLESIELRDALSRAAEGYIAKIREVQS
jgi:hypothetical protein